MKTPLGFIGLGAMGKPMARNLLAAGYPLAVYDVRPEPVQELGALGAEAGRSPRHVASLASTVITMLPSPQALEAVAWGEEGLEDGWRPGAIHIDMSTVHPQTSRTMARALAERGIEMLDAPVSRGQQAAIEGTLSIMVGGDRGLFERCLEIFKALGTDVYHCGASGMGSVVKLVNNLIVGIVTGAVAEGLVVGVKAGAKLETLLEVLTASSANNFPLQHFFPRKALRGDFEPGGSVDIVYKDLALALSLGEDVSAPMLFGALSHQLYGLLRGRGMGQRDFTGIISLFEEAAGVHVRFAEPR